MNTQPSLSTEKGTTLTVDVKDTAANISNKASETKATIQAVTQAQVANIAHSADVVKAQGAASLETTKETASHALGAASNAVNSTTEIAKEKATVIQENTVEIGKHLAEAGSSIGKVLGDLWTMGKGLFQQPTEKPTAPKDIDDGGEKNNDENEAA